MGNPKFKVMKCPSFKLFLFLLACYSLHGQQTVTLNPIANNTLYEDSGGSLSNGQGQYIFTGVTNVGTRRRALLLFDVAGSIPPNATITGATLSLTMNQTIVGATNVSIHAVSNSWGEGASMASGMEGGGAQSQNNDATWIHRFFSGTFWSNSGGDFLSTALANQSVAGNGTYTWSSPALLNQVQQWLSSPAANNGIIIIGDESTQPTAKRFHSRHSNSVSERPQLSVTYTVPCINPEIPSLQVVNGPFCSGDSVTISISGNLNSASNWHFYTGTCGGSFLGQVSGATFTTTLNQSANLFVRGEGACVSPGSCAQISVSVAQYDDPTFTYPSSSFCENDGSITPVINGTNGGNFSISPGGPQIQASTGTFLTNQASPGQPFTITYTTPGPQCPASSSQTSVVWPVDTVLLSQTICPGDSIAFGGQFVSQPGTYTLNLSSVNSCDSIVRLQLIWFPSQSAGFNYSSSTFCANQGQVLPQVTGTSGGVFTVQPAGAYINSSTGAIQTGQAPVNSPIQVTYTSPGPNCAVSSQQNITIFPSDTVLLSQTICPGDSLFFGGQYLSQAGTYNDLQASSLGCDSLVIMQLAVSNIDPSFSYPVSQVCVNDSPIIPVITGTQGGTFSSVPATLAVNMQTGVFQPGLALPSQTYQITYTTPGVNCAVSATQSILVLPVDTGLQTQSICPGDSILFHGQWIQNPGMYSTVIQSGSGCDSVEILQLSFLSADDASFSYGQDSVCTSASLLTPLLTGTSGGMFTVFPSVQGFDSLTGGFPAFAAQPGINYTVTYQSSETTCPDVQQRNLIVVASDTTQITASICSGDSLHFAGQWLTSSGIYANNLVNNVGCDSLVLLTLDVLPSENAAFMYTLDSVCIGATVLTPQISGTQGGTFSSFPVGAALDSSSGSFNPSLAIPGTTYLIMYQTPGASGCSDTSSQTLFVANIDTVQVGLILCQGDSVFYNGQYFYSGGNYTQTLSNVLGCDSIIQIDINIPSVNAVISVNADTLVAQNTSDSYQWFECDGNTFVPIPNAQQSSYLIEKSALYALVAEIAGCVDTSDCISAIYSSFENVSHSVPQLFPNPTRGRIIIDYRETGSFSVIDLNGRKVSSFYHEKGLGEYDISELQSGIYIIKFADGTRVRIIKLN
jgi:hypothetical protein